jgi:hypothetical protein
VFEIARSLFRTDVSRKEAKSQRRRCGGVGWGDCGLSFYRSAVLLGRAYERSEAFLCLRLRDRYFEPMSHAKKQSRKGDGAGEWGGVIVG